MTIQRLFADLFWVWVGSEILLQLVTRTSRSTGQIKDRGSLLLMFPVVFASSWWAMWYGDVHPHTMLGGAHWLRTAGLVFLILGLVIRWTAILTLGTTFSTNVAIHAAQILRTTGPYRWVRHPSYTGMLIIFTAIGLYERNWISLAVVLIFPTAALLYRIHVEEMALTEAFGKQYSEYSKATKRLLPGIY
ncbi:MAG: isoprenylcysteine carboxylmethyltransferase family protein [Terracidiphilus sp.]|jgi:protein-S-isoprenylcysteine O-methyltransferase Ste14